MLKNLTDWATTVPGFLAGAAGYVIANPTLFTPQQVHWAAYAMAVCMAFLGAAATSKSGGSK